MMLEKERWLDNHMYPAIIDSFMRVIQLTLQVLSRAKSSYLPPPWL